MITVGEPPAEPGPLKRGPDVQPLHLADARLVRAKRDAARRLVSVEREEEPAPRWGVVAGKLRELALEVLERQVDLEGGGVLLEERPYRRQAVFRVAVDDPQPHRAASVSASRVATEAADVTMSNMAQVVEPLQAARDAALRQSWRQAYDAYAGMDPDELSAEDLERYGEAAWWTGRLVEAIDFRQRAYRGYAADGQKRDAARVALRLSWDESGRGAFAVSHGWFANAQRLLEDEPEAMEHGHLALVRAINALFAEGDFPAAIAHFDRAFELGRRFGDRDTQMLALVGKGRALVKSGEIDAGLELLDEATAAAVSGELQPYSSTIVYCMTISSCHDLGDYRRAAEWTDVANRWCDQLDVTGFPGACRVHRAEIMRFRGDLEAAEKVAMAACRELQDFERQITSGGFYEIGEIRRRLGDLAAAEEAYGKANELGSDPQPGLALLRLAEGKVGAATAGITRSLEEAEQTPARLRRLPAQVEIAVAAGDLKTARAAAAEFETLVESYTIAGRRAPAFEAIANLADGRIRLAEGDAAGAAQSLRQARDGWKDLGAPYEAAEARLLLALAFRRHGRRARRQAGARGRPGDVRADRRPA